MSPLRPKTSLGAQTRTDEAMKTHRRNSTRRRLGALVAAALVASVAVTAAGVTSAAAATDIWVCAKPGSASIADPSTGGTSTVTISFTGFVQVATAADCATAIVMLGDPTPIRLSDGITYDVHVVNQTGFDINFSAAGLSGAPDLTGIADTATGTYTITPPKPGTYLYESSLDPRHSLLGLHGVIVVDPSPADGSAHGTAASAYDVEQVVVISEIDTSYNNAADPFLLDLLDYEPDLYLINGATHTDASALPAVLADPGQQLLLRYVNASAANDSMTVLGLHQMIVAFDGEIQDGSGTAGETPQDVSNVFLSAGQTADVILTVGGAPGDRVPIYNRNLRTSATNDDGQQLLMIEVGSGTVTTTTDLYLSLNNVSRSLAGVTVRDEDVAHWDGSVITIFFEGAAHGLIDGTTSADIDAVHVDPVSGDMWFSLRQDFPNPGGTEWAAVTETTLQENDIFSWDASAGTFGVWLDGSAIGLSDTTNRHDINGVQVDPISGITTFTTNGSIRTVDGVPLFTGSSLTFGARNEDVIRWVPVFGAADPSGPGAFETVADFSDLGLALENLDAVALRAGDVLFSLTTDFPNGTTPDFDRDDLVACLGHAPPPVSSVTDTCTAPLSLEFDADTLHPTQAGQVDAYSLG